MCSEVCNVVAPGRYCTPQINPLTSSELAVMSGESFFHIQVRHVVSALAPSDMDWILWNHEPRQTSPAQKYPLRSSMCFHDLTANWPLLLSQFHCLTVAYFIVHSLTEAHLGLKNWWLWIALLPWSTSRFFCSQMHVLNSHGLISRSTIVGSCDQSMIIVKNFRCAKSPYKVAKSFYTLPSNKQFPFHHILVSPWF